MTVDDSDFTQLLGSYLAFRRAGGYRLERAEKLLVQFGGWLHGQDPTPSLPRTGTARVLFTREQALTWASLPGGSPAWQHYRLGAVRSFALWLTTRGVPVDVPSLKVLPRAEHRAIPYQYSEDDITTLMATCSQVFTPFRAATMRTLTGLLTVTGLRVGEAINLDVDDLDLTDGRILVRRGKGERARLVFLRPSSCQAITDYLNHPLRPAVKDPALFVSLAGTRLLYCNVQEGFARMTRAAGLPSQPGARARLHDLRHRYATNTMAAAYRPGATASPERTLTLLATWLGHRDPASTYWYLQASPTLLVLAAARLEPDQAGTPQERS